MLAWGAIVAVALFLPRRFLPGFLSAWMEPVAHVVFFGVGAWLAVTVAGETWKVAVGVLLLLAVGSEGLQHVLPLVRGASVDDVAFNVAGIGVGVVLARVQGLRPPRATSRADSS